MKLHELTQLTDRRTRVGRGIAAGQGKTAGRGTKGQRSRTGRGAPVGFEGGQTRLYRRLPKVGGMRRRTAQPVTLTLTELSRRFEDGQRIDHRTLVRLGLIRSTDRARIVARGRLTRTGLRLAADVPASASARAALTTPHV